MKKILLTIVLLSTFIIANGQSLTLVSPTNNFRFKATASRLFVWNPPTGIATTSGITYTLKIVELPSVTTITASDFTTTTGFYTKTIGGISLITTSSHIVPTPFNIEKYYAWNIKAVVETSNQTIFTQSDVQYFKGRLSVEVFSAGFYNVFMEEIYNSDLTTFSGKGICPTGLGNTKSVTFSGLNISNQGGIFVLDAGAITYIYPNDTLIRLYDKAGVSQANAVMSGFRLDRNNFTTTNNSVKLNTGLKNIHNKEIILSSNILGGFDLSRQKIAGTIPLKSSLDTLSNISNTTLRITGEGSTKMYIFDNAYDCYHFGSFKLPIEKYGDSDSLNFSFNPVINYITPQLITPVAKINVPSISGLFFSSDSVFIDLTTTVSPPIYASNPAWQGMVFKNCVLNYETTVTGFGALKFSLPILPKPIATIENNANLRLVSTFTGNLTSTTNIGIEGYGYNTTCTYLNFKKGFSLDSVILKGKFQFTSYKFYLNQGIYDISYNFSNLENPIAFVENDSTKGSIAKSYIYDYQSYFLDPFKLVIRKLDGSSTIDIQASKFGTKTYTSLGFVIGSNDYYQITSGIETNTGYNFRVITTYDNGTKKDTSFAVPINTGNFKSVGITEPILSLSDIKTHPNPFIDEIKVLDFDANTVYNIELINSSGSVLVLNNYASDASSLVINSQNISSGLYTLKITTSKGGVVSKVIKL